MSFTPLGISNVQSASSLSLITADKVGGLNYQRCKRRKPSCSVCRGDNHTIINCQCVMINTTIEHLHENLENFYDKIELQSYLNRLSMTEIKILSCRDNLLKCSFGREYLTDKLICNYSKRQKSKRIAATAIVNKIRANHTGDILKNCVILEIMDMTYRFIGHNFPNSQSYTMITRYFRNLVRRQPPSIALQIEHGLNLSNTFLFQTLQSDTANSIPIQKWNITPIMLISEGDEDIIDCPICFEDHSSTNIVTTNCNHKFCSSCMRNHLDTYITKEAPPCPMCRSTINSTEIKCVNVYNQFKEKYVKQITTIHL